MGIVTYGGKAASDGASLLKYTSSAVAPIDTNATLGFAEESGAFVSAFGYYSPTTLQATMVIPSAESGVTSTGTDEYAVPPDVEFFLVPNGGNLNTITAGSGYTIAQQSSVWVVKDPSSNVLAAGGGGPSEFALFTEWTKNDDGLVHAAYDGTYLSWEDLYGVDSSSPSDVSFTVIVDDGYGLPDPPQDDEPPAQSDTDVPAFSATDESAPDANTFYIDADLGDDSNPGTQGEPWKNMSRIGTGTFSQGPKFLFKRGTRQVGTLPIPDCTSTQTDRIVYGAYGDENDPLPIITGGQRITGWTQFSGNRWRASLSGGEPYNVLIDNVIQQRSRWPKGDYHDTWHTIGSKTDSPESVFVMASGWPTINNLDNLTLIFNSTPYYTEYADVTAYNNSNGRITWSGGVFQNKYEAGWAFNLEGSIDIMTEEGEWAYQTGYLNFRKPASVDLNNQVVTAGVHDYGWSGDDRNLHVSFDQLDMSQYREAAIYLGNNTADVRVYRCDIHDCYKGVATAKYNNLGTVPSGSIDSLQLHVSNCDMENFFFEALFIENRKNTLIENCRISRGRDNLVKIEKCIFVEMRYTRIKDSDQKSCSFGRAVKNYRIHHCECATFKRTSRDGGALYSWDNQDPQYNTSDLRWDHNIIHDARQNTKRIGGNDFGVDGHCLYTDDGCHQWEIDSNICYDTYGSALFLHNSWDIHCHDNLIMSGSVPMSIIDDGIRPGENTVRNRLLDNTFLAGQSWNVGTKQSDYFGTNVPAAVKGGLAQGTLWPTYISEARRNIYVNGLTGTPRNAWKEISGSNAQVRAISYIQNNYSREQGSSYQERSNYEGFINLSMTGPKTFEFTGTWYYPDGTTVGASVVVPAFSGFFARPA